ncbi:MAG: helix-turn-helix domain-containing protein [Thermoleophilaceae bacterium]
MMELIEAGRSERQIAELTGVGRGTVNAWRHGRGTSYHRRVASATADWRPGSAPAYCSLLGIYLGDGHLTVRSRRASLVLYLDADYPAIVDAVAEALNRTFPHVRATHHTRVQGSVAAVQLSDPALPHAFPQHGVGRKHTRPIELTGWQRELTHGHPRELLRGLIHSDGCRCVNRFKTKLPSGRIAEYEYPRYFFSNLSADIRRIFCEHCELLGIRCTQSNPRNVSISHRKSVAVLDEFVGPKT